MHPLGIDNFLIFLAAGLIVNFTPGPDMMYVAARGASQGKIAGIVSALAIGTGTLCHTAAAALGLSVIISRSELAFSVVRFAGAAYLIYLGVRSFMDGEKQARGSLRPPDQPLKNVYWQGVLVNLLNPKVALFFLAFLPQFADPASGYFPLQIAFLGGVFITTGTIVLCLVAFLTGRIGAWLNRGGRGRLGSRLSGGVYIFLGLGLTLARK